MTLSTWNFVYALQFQSTKTISFHCVRYPLQLFMLALIFKIDLNKVEICSRIVRFISSMESTS